MGSKPKAQPTNKLWLCFACMQWFWLCVFVSLLLLLLWSVIGAFGDSGNRRQAGRPIPSNTGDHVNSEQAVLVSQHAHLRAQQEEVSNLLKGMQYVAKQTGLLKDGQSVLDIIAKAKQPKAQGQDLGKVVLHGPRIVVEILLSEHRPVISDVRGNLGGPSVVTEESVGDWLADRWQSARDMSGTPIPGEHFLEIDLQRLCTITKILLDWEDAFSDKYSVVAHNGVDAAGADAPRTKLATFRDARSFKGAQPKHILHEILVGHRQPISVQYRFVRLVIHGSATRWGPSLWRFHVYGWEGNGLLGEPQKTDRQLG